MKNIKLHIASTLMTLGMLPVSAMALTTTGTMNVSMVLAIPQLSASVTVAGPLNFGAATAGVATIMSGSTTFDVTVSNTTPYTINIDAGLWQNTTSLSRQLDSGLTPKSAADSISYDIWQNSGHTATWAPTGNYSFTGTGAIQTYNVFGQLNVATYHTKASTFSDSITITITY